MPWRGREGFVVEEGRGFDILESMTHATIPNILNTLLLYQGFSLFLCGGLHGGVQKTVNRT